jgi:hypothetical protein
METIFIPKNKIISEEGYFTQNGISELLKKYKESPKAILFIAEMLEI